MYLVGLIRLMWYATTVERQLYSFMTIITTSQLHRSVLEPPRQSGETFHIKNMPLTSNQSMTGNPERRPRMRVLYRPIITHPRQKDRRKLAIFDDHALHPVQNIVPNVLSVAMAFLGLDFPPSSVVGLRCLNVKPTNRLLLIGSSRSAMLSSAACLS